MRRAPVLRNHFTRFFLALALVAVAVFLANDTTPAQAQQFSSAGSLDVHFGSGGKVITDFGSGDDRAYAVAVQSDNKIVAAGYSDTGSVDGFAVARYNPDGSLDTSFSDDGMVTTSFGANIDQRAHALALQPDGKLVAAGYKKFGDALDLAMVRYNPDGTLDAGFGTGGKMTAAVNDDVVIHAVAIMPNGKIVIAGYSGNANDKDFMVSRYHRNGNLDTSFGNQGEVITDFGSGDDIAYAVAVQSDNKIVAAGKTLGDFALVRYNADGTLDTDFGIDGKVTTSFVAHRSGISGTDTGRAVVVLPNGKIVVAGGSKQKFALARYNPDGSPDDSFGAEGGKVQTEFSRFDAALALALQPDGKLVAAGRQVFGGNYDFALARYHRHGNLDASFGDGGKVGADIGNGANVAFGVALQSNGGIVAAGFSHNGSDHDFALARYHGKRVSTNANLSALTASSSNRSTGPYGPMALSPAFDKAITSYTATVAHGQTHAELTPTVEDTGKATLKVNGTAVASGTASAAINLAEGPNVITVQVTAEDSGTKEYTVTITRQAQTTVATPARNTLVSNLGQTAESATRTTNNVIQAQGFTTGNIPEGYRLSSIEASIQGAPTSAERDTIRAELWSWSTGPSSKLADLTVPAHPIAAGTVKFAVPDGTTLAPSESYFLVLYTTGTFNLQVTSTTADGEDAGSQAGWSVFNVFHNSSGAQEPSGSTTWTKQTTSDAALRIRVNGERILSSNANLSSLKASSSDSARRVFNDLALSPVFDKAITSYTATVAHDRTHAKLNPTVEDRGKATVAVRKRPTEKFASVDNSRTSAALALDVGANAITVRVTPEDGISKDYTVTIIRQGPTVSLSASPNPVDEGSSVTITATLSAALTSAVTIPLTIADNSAESGDHGTLAGITISSGSTSGTGTITTAQDADADHETFTVSLGTLPETVVAGSPSSVRVTIQDDEAAALPVYAQEVVWSGALTVADVGGVGPGCAHPHPCSDRLSPNQFTHEGTTYEIKTILLKGGKLSIRTNEPLPPDWALVTGDTWLHVRDSENTVASRKIVSWSDTNISWTAESTVSLRLMAPRISVPTVALSVSPNPVLEGGTVTVTATLSSALASNVTIPVAITLAGAPQSITINAGSTVGKAAIATAQDGNRCTAAGRATAEACEDESFTVELRSALPTAVRSGSAEQVTVNVIDDDVALPTVRLWVLPGSVVTEGDDATVRVEMSRLVRADVPIRMTYAGDSDGGNLNPAEPDDYSGPSEVVIPGGQTVGSGAIIIPDDGDVDELETFRVSLGTLPNWLRAGSPSSQRVSIKTAKVAPVVAAAINDVSGLEVGDTQDVSLTGVFFDADGDSLTITASSSDDDKATVTVAPDGSGLTLTGVAEGTVTVTVTAEDTDGNTVTDRFDVSVEKKYADLIADMYKWRNDPQWSRYKAHTDRWDRTLKTFGETVSDTSLTKMTADEAQTYVDKGWERWVPVTAALREIEGG